MNMSVSALLCALALPVLPSSFVMPLGASTTEHPEAMRIVLPVRDGGVNPSEGMHARRLGNLMDQLHMGFTRNQGQVADVNGTLRPDILFTADLGSARLYFTREGVSTVFAKGTAPRTHTSEATGRADRDPDRYDEVGPVERYRVDMHLVGANPHAVVTGEQSLSSYATYYLPQCPQGVGQVPSYRTLLYRDVYENIDLIYHSAGPDGIKYEFMVRPGGDPSAIQMRYSGAQPFRTPSDGNLHLTTPLGSMQESRPYAYQDNGEEPECSFSIDGASVGFEIGVYDPGRTLVIDPWGVYLATYGGGMSDLQISSSGDIVVLGENVNTAFPILNGFQTTKAGGYELFLAKFDGYGTMTWSTFYGGSGDEWGAALALNSSADAFFIGQTNSTNLPVPNAHQATFGGGYDWFIGKVGSAGTLDWATYLGGSGGGDGGHSIAVDGSGNIVCAGEMADAMSTINGCDNIYDGEEDVFLCKLTTSGTMVWSTFFGNDPNHANVTKVAIAENDTIIIGFRTEEPFGPMIHAWDATPNGHLEIVLAKMTPQGCPVWSTFIGGSEDEEVVGIKVLSNGTILMTGRTGSADFPIISGFQSVQAGDFDALLMEIAPDGTPLWSTFLGGSNRDNVSAFDVSVSGALAVGGGTYSDDFPVLLPFIGTFQGPTDGWIAKISTSRSLSWSSYVNGPITSGTAASAGISQVRFTGTGDILAGGGADKSNLHATMPIFPAPPTPIPAAWGGVFLMMIDANGTIPVQLSSLDATLRASRVHVTWTTETESNNLGFEVQRARSPETRIWIDCGFVPGAGTSAMRHEYAFTEDLPADYPLGQPFFYRLKQMDTDGTVSYSHEVMVFQGAPVDGLIIHCIYPQPASGSVMIEITSPPGDAIDVRVVDALGRTQWSGSLPGGTHRMQQVPIAGLAAGAYYLLASTAASTAVHQLLVGAVR
jgi:hypothetical protein